MIPLPRLDHNVAEFMLGSIAWQVAEATRRSPAEVLPIVEQEFESRAFYSINRITVIEIIQASIERVAQMHAGMIQIGIDWKHDPEPGDGQ